MTRSLLGREEEMKLGEERCKTRRGKEQKAFWGQCSHRFQNWRDFFEAMGIRLEWLLPVT